MSDLYKYVMVIALILVSMNVSSREMGGFEMPGTQVIPIADKQSGRQYELYVKLPDSYLENIGDSYPVIYFTDAVWHIELLSAVTAYMMEDVILVGVSWQKDMDRHLIEEMGAHASRFRDYSVIESGDADRQAKYKFGQAGTHLRFIRDDVFGYVEDQFRTDPSNRTYFGYSLGGVFGAYILSAKPDTFRNYILGSPSLRGDVAYLASLLHQLGESGHGLEANVFITRGDLESELGQYVDEFITVLSGLDENRLNVVHRVIEGSHQSAFPLTGVRSVAWLSELIKSEAK